MMEIAKDMAEHYKSKGHEKEAERWEYRRALCFNTLEYRLQRYFED
ncbi:hypothetical protein LS482_16115 [Sinomicrobium kalidii]|nr:hypothetical protein [Sinomicrobium kalidii]UGU15198.1 hypothetical protein LS482_16115 [Sinomicrobium kalidii]